jgi:hypothetical protein
MSIAKTSTVITQSAGLAHIASPAWIFRLSAPPFSEAVRVAGIGVEIHAGVSVKLGSVPFTAVTFKECDQNISGPVVVFPMTRNLNTADNQP